MQRHSIMTVRTTLAQPVHRKFKGTGLQNPFPLSSAVWNTSVTSYTLAKQHEASRRS